MSRFGRRRRRRLVLLTVFSLFAVAVMIYRLGFRSPHAFLRARAVAQAPPGTVRLPFTLPCALYSGDASPVYAAIRQRDRNALMSMVAQKRLMMVREGTSVALLPVNNIATVSIYSGARDGRTCYVPSDIVSVIERRVPRQ
ncbi:MAG: hypothetical protein WA324_29200 [Bryobacteraceae bacterium]